MAETIRKSGLRYRDALAYRASLAGGIQLDCGQQAEEASSQERDSKGECKHPTVNRKRWDIAEILRFQHDERMLSPISKHKAGKSTDESEQCALGNKLTDETSARCSQSHADGDLLPSPCRLRKQKIGKISAGYQEHDHSRRKEHE